MQQDAVQKEQHISKQNKQSDGMILAAANRTNIVAAKPPDKKKRLP
jgi:hypothetical protein